MSFSRKDMARIALGLVDAVKRKPRSSKRKNQPLPQHDGRGEVDPFAPPPPRLTAETWAATCIMREHRCHSCEQCSWEMDVERWHQARNTHERARDGQLREEQPTTFRRLDQALQAFVDWERHNRWSASAQGQIQDRLEQGATHGQAGTNYRRDREDPFLRRATDVIEVQQAVAHAFEGNRWGLEARECVAMLVARVGHIRETLPKYEEMELRFKLPAELIKSIVRHGRRGITVELAARGVIPMPQAALGLHYDVDCRRRELETRTRVTTSVVRPRCAGKRPRCLGEGGLT